MAGDDLNFLDPAWETRPEARAYADLLEAVRLLADKHKLTMSQLIGLMSRVWWTILMYDAETARNMAEQSEE